MFHAQKLISVLCDADFRVEMSPFGAIFTLLESWPTESTRAYLVSEDNADRQLRQSQILGTSQQMLKTMSTILARVVPLIMREMQIKVPRSTVEKHLYEMLASMHFPTPIPAIKVIFSTCLTICTDRHIACCSAYNTLSSHSRDACLL